MNQILLSFDTTNSMYPGFAQIRTTIDSLIIPTVTKYIGETAFGVIIHNDYTEEDFFVSKQFPLSTFHSDTVRFIKSAKSSPRQLPDAFNCKCYELIFAKAFQMAWKENAQKLFIFTANGIPHEPDFTSRNLDWRERLNRLKNNNIRIGTLRLNNKRDKTVNNFYRELSEVFNISYARTDFYCYIPQLLIATILYTYRADLLSEYISELNKDKTTDEKLNTSVNDILRKKPTENTTSAVSLKFQKLGIYRDITLKELYSWHGLHTFKPDRGFYEIHKPTNLLSFNELLLEDKLTGEIYDNLTSKQSLGIDRAQDFTINPAKHERYRVFIRTTSLNNKLHTGDHYLYEV